MKKIFFVFLIFTCLLFSQTQIFLQITKNLLEKANVLLIFKIDKNDFSEKFINTFSNDLKLSGYFKLEGIKFTENIEKTEKEIMSGIIITGEKKQDILNIKVKDGIEKKILYENNYKFIQNPREFAHIICDDIVEKLTGKPGIATSKVFFTSDKTGKNQIYLIDYDGYNLIQITDLDYFVNFPRYLEGNYILFVSYQDGWPKIARMDILTKKIETLIAKPGLNACMSPNLKTKEIAVVLSQSGNPEIYISDFKGEIRKRLTNHNGIDSSPSFSPDGKNIVFVSDRDGKPQIYIMDRDGFGTRRISYISNYCTSPSFSPDGNFIAYVFADKGGYSLAIYDLNTTKTKIIKNLNCEEISWAPNSRHIAYSTSGKSQKIMIVDIFTNEIRELISGNFKCISPNWFYFK
ncbi:MAG: hypothetical protein NC915_03460 [Candidatus Omnitrophica bacterium]|nr:hypothetical protein [Candidatus Omnitrophota bacterium]